VRTIITTKTGRFTSPEGSMFAATTPATTSVIGAVGPVICTGVPPSNRRDDAGRDGAVKARRWAQSRSDAEGECQRQRHHAGRDTAENIAASHPPGRRGGARIDGYAHGFAYSLIS